MDKTFAKYTRKILDSLPYWFKMKKKPSETVGAEFLNITGLELDQVEYIMNYAYNQTTIQNADDNFTDIIYKTLLPDYITPTSDVSILSQHTELVKSSTVKEFLIMSNENMIHPEIYNDDPYYIDYDKRILYVKHPYSNSKLYPDGKITIKADDRTNDLKLSIHHVWNFFDEFGMLLSCPRLYGEQNKDYKARLLDVFKNKANSSMSGLSNGIARELNLRIEQKWEDGGADFKIEHPMVILNEIKVDGEYISIDDVFLTNYNTVIIPGNPEYVGTSRIVTYISGLEMHQLHNKQDHVLQRQLYNVDKTATSLLKYYADRIRQEVPIMWNQWKWNEGYWDVADEEMSGYACLPNIMDAKIDGFINYDKSKKTNIYINKPATLTDIYVHPDVLYMQIGEDSNVISDITLSSLNIYPSPLKMNRGDIVELSYNG